MIRFLIQVVLVLAVLAFAWSKGGKAERHVATIYFAVVFAGITVIIAMMGMFALGFEFMNGLAVAMSIGVFVVLLASITILPALLAIFGTRVGRLSRRARHREEAAAVGAFVARFLFPFGD